MDCPSRPLDLGIFDSRLEFPREFDSLKEISAGIAPTPKALFRITQGWRRNPTCPGDAELLLQPETGCILPGWRNPGGVQTVSRIFPG